MAANTQSDVDTRSGPGHAQQRALIIALLVAALAMAAPSGWALFVQVQGWTKPAPPPISYPTLPLRVENQPLHVGDTLVVQVTRCVTDDGDTGLGRLPFWFTARLVGVDGQRLTYDLSGGFSQADVGCHPSRQTALRVPDTALPGHYYLEGTTTAAGARRAATVGWRTDMFEVVP